MWELAIPVAIGVLAIFVIGFMFATLYRRSTRDEAYVRTGLGGQKVVLDGGSVVLPVFHSTAAVNLKTGTPTAAQVAAAVDSVTTDPSYRDAAARVGAQLRSLGGAARAAELLEQLAQPANESTLRSGG